MQAPPESDPKKVNNLAPTEPATQLLAVPVRVGICQFDAGLVFLTILFTQQQSLRVRRAALTGPGGVAAAEKVTTVARLTLSATPCTAMSTLLPPAVAAAALDSLFARWQHAAAAAAAPSIPAEVRPLLQRATDGAALLLVHFWRCVPPATDADKDRIATLAGDLQAFRAATIAVRAWTRGQRHG